MNIVIIIVVLLLLYVVYIFNRCILLRNRVKEASSDILVQLKRRHELIPNLISTVEGYAKHEKDVFITIAKIRSEAISGLKSGDVAHQAAAENNLSSALKSVFAVAESYPELKANENFLELQDELTDTENKIQASRRFYNTNVLALNTLIEQFPSSIIAKATQVHPYDFFTMEESSHSH